MTAPSGERAVNIKQLQARVEVLEAEVKRLREQLAADPPKRSIVDLFGKYANDPAAEEADRLMFEQIERQRKKDLAALGWTRPA
jgi:hypothetical protein